VPVLMPDTYAPYTLAGLDFKNSPFLAGLGNLMLSRVCLQTILRDPSLQVSKTDLDNLAAQRKTDADKLKADEDQVKQGKLSGKALEDKEAEISDLKQKNQKTDADIKKDTAALAQVNDINASISSIDTFLGSLTGSIIAAPGPSSQTANSQNPPSGSPTQSPTGTSSGTPPIAAVLAADGLAQVIGVGDNGALSAKSIWQHVLLLKALESGGSLITHSNIFGSKVFFTGGAVATYALFTPNGRLSCSGNVYDYGGYIRAKDFELAFRNPTIDPTRQLIFLRGGCRSPDTAQTGSTQ